MCVISKPCVFDLALSSPEATLLVQKLAKAEGLIDYFPHGSYIGWSGFTGVGYPKYYHTFAILNDTDKT